MMKSIENKGITVTVALKNEVAGKTKPLYGLANVTNSRNVMRNVGKNLLENILKNG
jgi:hypothetical protein